MSRGAFALFLVIGLLATVALAIPGAVFVAALFLIVPGVVLWLSVPIFMYAAFVYAARHLTGGLRRPVRLAIVVGAVAALAVIPTWLLNQRTDAQRWNWLLMTSRARFRRFATRRSPSLRPAVTTMAAHRVATLTAT